MVTYVLIKVFKIGSCSNNNFQSLIKVYPADTLFFYRR